MPLEKCNQQKAITNQWGDFMNHVYEKSAEEQLNINILTFKVEYKYELLKCKYKIHYSFLQFVFRRP